MLLRDLLLLVLAMVVARAIWRILVGVVEGLSARVFFCSANCRDKYRARPSTGSGRPEPAEGRSA
jgi:hypothetical protein